MYCLVKQPVVKLPWYLLTTSMNKQAIFSIHSEINKNKLYSVFSAPLCVTHSFLLTVNIDIAVHHATATSKTVHN